MLRRVFADDGTCKDVAEETSLLAIEYGVGVMRNGLIVIVVATAPFSCLTLGKAASLVSVSSISMVVTDALFGMSVSVLILPTRGPESSETRPKLLFQDGIDGIACAAANIQLRRLIDVHPDRKVGVHDGRAGMTLPR